MVAPSQIAGTVELPDMVYRTLRLAHSSIQVLQGGTVLDVYQCTTERVGQGDTGPTQYLSCRYVEIANLTFKHLHELSLDWHIRKKTGNTVGPSLANIDFKPS